jgi:hypothetical protein
MKFYCTIFCLWLTNFVFAQQQADTLRNDNQISRKGSGWKMNGKNISWKEAKVHIRQVPEAVPFLKKAYNNEKLAYLCLVPLTVSVLMTPRPQSENYTESRNIIFRSFAAASAVAIIYFMLQRSKNWKKAVLIHNEKRAIVY